MRRLLAGLATFLLILSAQPSPAGAADDSKYGLSDYGHQAVLDLATCLRTATSLDVYYLIDNSSSLGPDKVSGTSGSDPKNERRGIIRQDIKRWGDISAQQSGLKVRVAGSLFNASTTKVSDWQEVNSSNSMEVADSLTSAVNNKNLGNYTNWLAALNEASSQLSGSTATCKAVIWFTDGGLWMPGTNSNTRSSSLDAVAAICGGGSKSALQGVASGKGLLAKMRQDGIHLFGILLNVGADTDANESYYRSLMQPMIEESGNVQPSGGLPGGAMVCGENLPANQRTYAAGAFLQATSAADVAYSFMTIPSVVSGGSQEAMNCVGSGEFFVDPGIDSFEVSTDATSWVITDDKGATVSKSPVNFSTSGTFTTGRISLPHLQKSAKWKFVPMGGKGMCQLFVYPELELSLHSKALISGKKSSVTGQFVKSVVSGEKADLSVYKDVEFHAFVNKRDYPNAQLDSKTGEFIIRDYTPTSRDAENQALFGASLKLSTEHYDLYPISFEQAEPVYNATALPSVGEIRFVKGISSAKDSAVARVTIAPPATDGLASQICFDKYSVIADRQDESAGKATDRSASWTWTTRGLDRNGCLDVLMGLNKSQVITFHLANPKQANSRVSALFEYRISAGELTGVKDSQTAGFESKTKTSGPLFWIWVLILMIAGLAVPFGILTVQNLRGARFARDPNLQEAVFKFEFENDVFSLFSQVEVTPRYVGSNHDLAGLDESLAFDFRAVPAPVASGQKRITLNNHLLLGAVAPFNPLAGVKYKYNVLQPVVLLTSRGRFSNLLTSGELPNDKIGQLSYLQFDNLQSTGGRIEGFAHVYLSQLPSRPTELYLEAISSLLTNADLKAALKKHSEERSMFSDTSYSESESGHGNTFQSSSGFSFDFKSDFSPDPETISGSGESQSSSGLDSDFRF